MISEYLKILNFLYFKARDIYILNSTRIFTSENQEQKKKLGNSFLYQKQITQFTVHILPLNTNLTKNNESN